MSISYSSKRKLELGQSPEVAPGDHESLYKELLALHNAIEQIAIMLTDLEERIIVLEP
mgnify:CR=1 FL=1